MKKYTLSLIPLVALLSLALACNFVPGAPAPTKTSVSTSVPIATSPAPSADPSRYLNEEGKFSLKLPEGWKTIGPLKIDNDPARAYNLYLLGSEPNTDGGPGSSKIAILDPAQWTPESYAQSQCSTCDPFAFTDLALGGKPARRVEVGGGGIPFKITWTFAENNGNLIALAIHDPETLKPLDEVIDSVQWE